jgi:hypothetical protein
VGAAIDDVHGVEDAEGGELAAEAVDLDVEAVAVVADAAKELVLVDPAALVAGAVALVDALAGEREQQGVVGATP